MYVADFQSLAIFFWKAWDRKLIIFLKNFFVCFCMRYSIYKCTLSSCFIRSYLTDVFRYLLRLGKENVCTGSSKAHAKNSPLIGSQSSNKIFGKLSLTVKKKGFYTSPIDHFWNKLTTLHFLKQDTLHKQETGNFTGNITLRAILPA